MGCYLSIPHSKRRYRDPADLDEEIVPLRRFGQKRNGQTNLPPDDAGGLPSTHIRRHLASDPGTLLYDAEIDQGRSTRCFRPLILCYLCPPYWVYLATAGLRHMFRRCPWDEICCWVRKEYSTRTFLRVYPNRIEANAPALRGWGLCGCGSWNADYVATHPFDRGAFGFHPVRCGAKGLLCCTWNVYGGVVARQRCDCNGALWPRLGDCGGWWCDEWLCDVCGCTYSYEGLADADETAFAAGVALQAYFEGRVLTKAGMDRCLDYWRENVSEMEDPEKKRDVCCEPLCIPCCPGHRCYELTNVPREIPYSEDDPRCTAELLEVYQQHTELRAKQVHNYKTFFGPVRNSTVCRAAGCRRVFGRRGLIFCTEGCCDDPAASCSFQTPGEPAPPFKYRDVDDEHDASVVLRRVLGDPPPNVAYRWWQYNEEGTLELRTLPATEEGRGSVESGSLGNTTVSECTGKKCE